MTEFSNPVNKGEIYKGSIDEMLEKARELSVWGYEFASSCCSLEFLSCLSPVYDWELYGFKESPSMNQSDLLIVTGTIGIKLAERLKYIYRRMPSPKYVVAVGGCAISGGPYREHGYSIVKGADKLIPVDIYIPGCPPRPEAVLEGLLMLKEKIRHGEDAV